MLKDGKPPVNKVAFEQDEKQEYANGVMIIARWPGLRVRSDLQRTAKCCCPGRDHSNG